MPGQATNLKGHFLTCGAGLAMCVIANLPASAQAVIPVAAAPDQSAFAQFASGTIGAMVLACGFLLLAIAACILLLRSRAQSQGLEARLKGELSATRARLDRSETLLASESHLVVTFGGAGEEPDVSGDLASRIMLPPGRRILGFNTWLLPDAVVRLEQMLEGLRERGEAFHMTTPTKRGSHVAIDGRAVGGRAIMRIRDVTGERLALAELETQHTRIQQELEQVRGLLNSVPQPAWLRDKEGKLVWVNHMFAQAVEADMPETVIARHLELLDQPVRNEAMAVRAKGDTFSKRVAAVVAGQRRLLDVIEAPGAFGAAGLAVDVSELEDMRGDLVRRMEAHRRTLDELATGVAIFSADGSLAFYNQAYRQLWNLESAFLEQGPSDTTILDRLRAARQLPEQADFRSWKSQLHEAYHILESREHWWYLPDGRALRVVQTPNPEGGVTYLFDDVSERINLESRYNALIHVQSETLDHLQEGVAVFGSDGRLKLHNPAFAHQWKLDCSVLKAQPHADQLFELCSRQHPQDETWKALKSSVTTLPEKRTPLAFRTERADGVVIDIATVPLPDGGTLITFIDITANVAMERALRERNEALETAAQVKTDFVKHVSYELRSPLTNIIGFTQLLGDATAGPLTQRQEEYAGHILDSSAALLAIINDILDLATIDAGAMELHVSDVNIRSTMDAAAEGVRDRLAEANIKLNILAPAGIGAFKADEKRVRQVLFNLLSNAVGFSMEGGVVTLSSERQANAVIFRVTDNGRGMAPEVAARIFDRFESHTQGSRHRGVGLGLSIVRSFVELHGGSVSLESKLGEGTTVTCIFPLERDTSQVAAE
jgi:signal transduction histidine kinase